MSNDSGTFRQLKKLSYNRITNNSAKASTFSNDITTLLFGGTIRAVRNEYMLLIFLNTQCAKCSWKCWRSERLASLICAQRENVP